MNNPVYNISFVFIGDRIHLSKWEIVLAARWSFLCKSDYWDCGLHYGVMLLMMMMMFLTATTNISLDNYIPAKAQFVHGGVVRRELSMGSCL